jgi:protein-S-isoprenylcysteine O-methyltransferase Ste14
MLRLPPPIWAFIYLAVAVAVSMTAPWRSLVDLQSIIPGAVLVAVGAALAFSAVRLFRAEGTELNPTSEANKALVRSGPYRFTRNPMYLGLTVTTLGIAIWVGSLPLFAVPLLIFATANWVHIPFEEEKMRRQFGAAYEDFTQQVRRWI